MSEIVIAERWKKRHKAMRDWLDNHQLSVWDFQKSAASEGLQAIEELSASEQRERVLREALKNARHNICYKLLTEGEWKDLRCEGCKAIDAALAPALPGTDAHITEAGPNLFADFGIEDAEAKHAAVVAAVERGDYDDPRISEHEWNQQGLMYTGAAGLHVQLSDMVEAIMRKRQEGQESRAEP
jgi:hypothetical protein